jgi:hypothetical protein
MYIYPTTLTISQLVTWNMFRTNGTVAISLSNYLCINMKKILLLAALFTTVALQAQITVTNSIFPVAGDVLARSVTNNIGIATITPAAATAQAWDFSFLTTDFFTTDSIVAASTGASYAQFPTSDVLTPLLGLGTAYTDVTTTAVINVGAGIEFFGLSFVAPFSNPQTLQTAPLNYNTSTNDTYSLAFAENIDSIPFLRQLIDSLNPLPGVTPDSIRLRLTGTTTMLVDAFGTVQLFDSTYNVLRQKFIVYNDIKIDIHFYAFGFPVWQDVTNLIGSQLPIPLTDTTYRYDYIAAGKKSPVLRLNMDNLGTNIQSAEFKGNNPTGIFQTAAALTAVQVFPNPTSNLLTLRTENFEVDQFNVQIVDVLGRVVLVKNNLQGHTNQLSLSDLAEGNYVLLFSKENGALLAREQVVIKR